MEQSWAALSALLTVKQTVRTCSSSQSVPEWERCSVQQTAQGSDYSKVHLLVPLWAPLSLVIVLVPRLAQPTARTYSSAESARASVLMSERELAQQLLVRRSALRSVQWMEPQSSVHCSVILSSVHSSGVPSELLTVQLMVRTYSLSQSALYSERCLALLMARR